MRFFKPSLIFSLWLSLIALEALATEEISFAYHGYSGLFNTPSADVLPTYHMTFGVNNHRRVLQGKSNEAQNDWAESYLFGFGLYQNLEISGNLYVRRNEEIDEPIQKRVGRDTIGTIKYRIPWHPISNVAFAIGAQDIGGGSVLSRTAYGVADYKLLSDLNISLGLGSGPDRLDTFFGGIQWTPYPGFNLIAEHDGEELFRGLRLQHRFANDITLNLQFSNSSKQLAKERGDIEYGFNLVFPLAKEAHRPRYIESLNESHTLSSDTLRKQASNTNTDFHQTINHSDASQLRKPDQANKIPTPKLQNAEIAEYSATQENQLNDLKTHLTNLGLSSVRVSPHKNQLLVEYANYRFSHNELDALGLVLAEASHAAHQYPHIKVVIKRYGYNLLSVSTKTADYRHFLETGLYQPSLLSITSCNDNQCPQFTSSPTKNEFRSELYLYPDLITVLGGELQTIDHSLALVADWYVPLWKGGLFNVMTLPFVDDSRYFDDPDVFGGFGHPNNDLQRFMLHQTIQPLDDVFNMTSLGQLEQDVTGILNELQWRPANTPHNFRLRSGIIDDQRIDPFDRQGDYYLGSYRYHIASLNSSLEFTTGQFLYGDQGVEIDLRRFIGDSQVRVFYQQTDDDFQTAGIGLVIPLTPRQEMKPGWMQVKGDSQFEYRIRKTANAEGSPELRPTVSVIPQLAHNLDKNYFDRNRLTSNYIKLHIARLREAYLTFRID